VANIFIDELPIKGSASIYPDKNGKPEILEENPASDVLYGNMLLM